MSSVGAPLTSFVGYSVTGALTHPGASTTLMVAPPRPKTGPFLATGVDPVIAHAPGMAPVFAPDPNVDPNPAPGLEPVDANAPGVKPVVAAQCLGPSLAPGSSPVIAHVSFS